MEILDSELRFFFLHWVRCIALLGPIPLFGQGPAVRVHKIGMGVMVGTIVAIHRDSDQFVDPGFTGHLVVAVIGEALMGYLLGFVANLTFDTIRVAGHLIGSEMGFSIASIQDPISGVNVQVIAHILESFSIIVFFSVGGHATILRALSGSFERYEVGQFHIGPALIEAVILFSTGLFATAFELAAPILVAMIVGGIALAIVARVAPQMQVMQFAYTFKILVGMLLIISTLELIVPAMGRVFARGEDAFAIILGV